MFCTRFRLVLTVQQLNGLGSCNGVYSLEPKGDVCRAAILPNLECDQITFLLREFKSLTNGTG